MVKVREDLPLLTDGRVDIDRWIERLPEAWRSDSLHAACQLAQEADQRPPAADSGVDPEDAEGTGFLAGLEMADILMDLRLDSETLIAAVLYRAVREGKLPLEDVQRRFGKTIAKLIRGVQQMAAIARARYGADDGELPVLGQTEAQKENIRKMLVSLVDDVRVALIKLAERTVAIRAVKNHLEKRETVAREVFDIYAPLAHRLGIGHIKWELEDLSFRYLQPHAYKKIAKLLDERRVDRQHFIESVKEQLSSALNAEGIDEFELSGRAKHIYSIWRKMRRKGIGFSQIYDIRAVRILVPDIRDCYQALSVVHRLWRNIAGEFDDYISNPKENGYRSLHTAVIGPEGKVLEVQIRTFKMHEEAEYGVCAHWRYKGADNADKAGSSYEEKIAWLRQVLEWHEEAGGAGDISDQLGGPEVAQDRIYVFTPNGHVVSLAQGSTPLDFAYHIHTEVGHRCRGAKVNGRIVPLTYELKTGEQVEVITGKEEAPRRDWLQHSLGYLKSARARAKVQHWFRLQDRDDNVAAGRALLEKELRRLALNSFDYKAVAARLQYGGVEDMFAAVGAGELSAAQVLAVVNSLLGHDTAQAQLELQIREQPRRPRDSSGDGNITIHGVGNLLTHIARCCKPVPGDEIAGYVTQGRGVAIHRQDCTRLLQLSADDPARVMEVSWGGSPEQAYPVTLAIEAYDRPGLLRDITQLLAGERVNVIAVNTRSDKNSSTAQMRLTVEIATLDLLSRLLTKLNRLANIISASRVREEH